MRRASLLYGRLIEGYFSLLASAAPCKMMLHDVVCMRRFVSEVRQIRSSESVDLMNDSSALLRLCAALIFYANWDRRADFLFALSFTLLHLMSPCAPDGRPHHVHAACNIEKCFVSPLACSDN